MTDRSSLLRKAYFQDKNIQYLILVFFSTELLVSTDQTQVSSPIDVCVGYYVIYDTSERPFLDVGDFVESPCFSSAAKESVGDCGLKDRS